MEMSPCGVMLPGDGHGHSEWHGTPAARHRTRPNTRRTCEQAVRIGVPALAFTEQLDFDDRWKVEPEDLHPQQPGLITDSGHVAVPLLDVEGYLDCVDRCRHRFPELRILTGVEFGQPHLQGPGRPSSST